MSGVPVPNPAVSEPETKPEPEPGLEEGQAAFSSLLGKGNIFNPLPQNQYQKITGQQFKHSTKEKLKGRRLKRASEPIAAPQLAPEEELDFTNFGTSGKKRTNSAVKKGIWGDESWAS